MGGIQKRFVHRARDAWRLIAHGLSGRILVLTVLFVMAIETLIYFPSAGRYHDELLNDRIQSAELAILPFTEARYEQFSAALRMELLARAGVHAVIVKRDDQRELFLVDVQPPEIDATFDLRDSTFASVTIRAFDSLLFGGERTLRVIAPTRIQSGETIEVVAAEGPIRTRLLAYSGGLLGLSLLISGFTAGLVFLSLYLVVVRPIERLSHAMIAYRADPEDPVRILAPSARKDEIGVAERELAGLQRELYGFLQQKARLANLGAAVAKIQHDLRNILASAQIASDRLAAVDDPVVKTLSLRLVAALDRAVALATNTLEYGKADERPPDRRRMTLAPLVAEAGAAAVPEGGRIVFLSTVSEDVVADADSEHLFRALLNLARNAREALESRGAGEIRVSAKRAHDGVTIDVADNGPGIPEAMREKLFQPFAGSVRRGGTGLGLAIARELMRAHGGDVTLVRTGPEGTLFRIEIPDRRTG